MELKDYVAQYKNVDLCSKWNNSIPCEELNDSAYMLLTNSQDIDSVVSNFQFLLEEGITGALVTVSDGDYGEVYVTESRRPYSLDAIYHPLDYYL